MAASKAKQIPGRISSTHHLLALTKLIANMQRINYYLHTVHGFWDFGLFSYIQCFQSKRYSLYLQQ